MKTLRLRRKGTIIPTLAVSLIGIVSCIALGIDLGLIAVARVQTQSAADAGALAGVRAMSADPAISQAAVKTMAKDAALAAVLDNSVISKPLLATDVSSKVGIYYYDRTSTPQQFRILTNDTSQTNPTNGAVENWSALQISVTTQQPTYFARVMGITQFTMTTEATSVHRPRDMALILDFSGSMQFSSWNTVPYSGTVSGSMNPDPNIPNFGPWSRYQLANNTRLRRVTNYGTSPYIIAPSNYTMDSAGSGPAIVRDFNCIPDARSTGVVSFAALQNAFVQQADPDTLYEPYTPAYTAALGVDWWSATAKVGTPAPTNFATQTDTPIAYIGDLWPRRNRRVSATATEQYARTVYHYLSDSSSTSNGHRKNNTDPNAPIGDMDPSNDWETVGYDGNLDGRLFKGFSMGPGYYGKTFFMWPPDPRTPAGVDPADAGYVAGDWRKRFYHYPGNTSQRMDDNSRLFMAGTDGRIRPANANTYTVDYEAVLRWIKFVGPAVFPPNLRAGRVLYYRHIPSDVNTGTGSAEERLDKVFWREYINHVLGADADQDDANLSNRRTLLGISGNSWNGDATIRITAKSSLTGQDGISGNADDPYMHYNDVPRSPLLHYWFGPMSMIDFIVQNNTFERNWAPGTCHEAQSWQLKAGVNSALADIEKNHPNDQAALIYFNHSNAYNTAVVSMGRDYNRMRNALFFPKSLLSSLGDETAEFRPYSLAWSDQSPYSGGTTPRNIPNSAGSTCPHQGLLVAYNEFSSRTSPAYNGRRGAAKVVILETDGIPNYSYTNTYVNGGAYNSYYTLGSATGGGASQARTATQAICALDTAGNPGYSGSLTARVHAIGFGDIFNNMADSSAITAANFLLDIQKDGKTSPTSATSIESYKIITGDFNTRIGRLRDALTRIMQSGVQVSLVKGTNEN